MSFYRALDRSVLRASSRVEQFVSTAWTSGPWSKELQHGGPPTALLARCIERLALDHGFSHIARISASFLRAVPAAAGTLHVTSSMCGAPFPQRLFVTPCAWTASAAKPRRRRPRCRTAVASA
jgi:hypothetical protein